MSTLKYYSSKSAEKNTKEYVIVLPSREESGVCKTEYDSIQEEILDGRPKKKKNRKTYSEGEKIMIAKHADTHGVASAVRFFKKDFPSLTESTVRPWRSKFKDEINKNKSVDCAIISEKRGRPLLLPTELDKKLRLFIANMRSAGGTINKHVVYGILLGLIKADLPRYDGYLDFVVTKGWLQFLYKRINFSKNIGAPSRSVTKVFLSEEVRTQFHNNIASEVLKYNIPDELILNIDQTLSKYVATETVTISEAGSKHVSRKDGNDKRGITVTLSQTLDGKILPFQLIYTGISEHSIPAVEFPNEFCLSYNSKHWSNEEQTIRLLQEVIDPFVRRVKEELKLPNDQKSLIIWDAFTDQSTDKVFKELELLNFLQVQVPKSMKHLLQPLDLTTKASMKEMEKKAFSEYFTNAITKEMLLNPGRDVTTIEVDLRLSTLKPEHANVMKNVYAFFKTERGRQLIMEGWRAAGISDILETARKCGLTTINPVTMD